MKTGPGRRPPRRARPGIVHFLHVRKTGGTAVRHVLEEHAADSPCDIRLHTHEFTLRDVPVGESAVWFLRDPLSRFVSGFYSRQRQGRPKYFVPWRPAERAAFEHFATPNALALALSSDDPSEVARAQAAMRGVNHVRSSYWDWFESAEYLESRSADVLFVGSQENLAGDFETLKSILGLPEDAALPTDEVLAHQSPRGLDRHLDEQATRNLEHWYREEYACLEACAALKASAGGEAGVSRWWRRRSGSSR